MAIGIPDFGEVVHSVNDGTDVIELFHDFHKEFILSLEEGDACGVRRESRKFIAEHILQSGAQYHHRLSFLLQEWALDGERHNLVVFNVLIQDIQ